MLGKADGCIDKLGARLGKSLGIAVGEELGL
jgi:hypothetical protein